MLGQLHHASAILLVGETGFEPVTPACKAGALPLSYSPKNRPLVWHRNIVYLRDMF
jgi:hypothetical protein